MTPRKYGCPRDEQPAPHDGQVARLGAEAQDAVEHDGLVALALGLAQVHAVDLVPEVVDDAADARSPERRRDPAPRGTRTRASR